MSAISLWTLHHIQVLLFVEENTFSEIVKLADFHVPFVLQYFCTACPCLCILAWIYVISALVMMLTLVRSPLTGLSFYWWCLHNLCKYSNLQNLVRFQRSAHCSRVYCEDAFGSPWACSLFNMTALNHVTPPPAHTIHMHTQTLSSKHNMHKNRHTNTFGKITSLTITTSKSITLAHTLISLTMIRFKLVTATAMVNQYPNLPTIYRQPCGTVNISLWETY